MTAIKGHEHTALATQFSDFSLELTASHGDVSHIYVRPTSYATGTPASTSRTDFGGISRNIMSAAHNRFQTLSVRIHTRNRSRPSTLSCAVVTHGRRGRPAAAPRAHPSTDPH
jgi:hypothetical protein